METLPILFTAGIFFTAFLSLLGLVFNLLLNPIKYQIKDLKESHKELKESQDELKESHRELKESHRELNQKLDKLLESIH